MIEIALHFLKNIVLYCKGCLALDLQHSCNQLSGRSGQTALRRYYLASDRCKSLNKWRRLLKSERRLIVWLIVSYHHAPSFFLLELISDTRMEKRSKIIISIIA